jgi:hypothetical protein
METLNISDLKVCNVWNGLTMPFNIIFEIQSSTLTHPAMAAAPLLGFK